MIVAILVTENIYLTNHITPPIPSPPFMMLEERILRI